MPASCSAVTRRITKAQAANSTSAGSSAPGRTLPEQPRRAHEATPRGHSTKKPHQAIAAKATASPTRTTLPAQGLDDVASVLQQFATSMRPLLRPKPIRAPGPVERPLQVALPEPYVALSPMSVASGER